MVAFTLRSWHRCHRSGWWRRMTRQITHNIAQRGRRARLNAGPRTSQHVFGWPEIRSGIALRRGKCRLQRPDRLIECQSLRLQNLRCRTFSITDDGREYNRTIDVTPPAAARSSSRGFEDASHCRRYSQGSA